MPHLNLKRKLAMLWPSQTKNRKIILLYHSVGDTAWAMLKNQFIDQINWLTEHCEVMSLTDLIASPASSVLQVAITFDDGYVSLHQETASYLQKKNVCPTVYINTGWISETEKTRKVSQSRLGHYPNEWFMTWNEVQDLQQAGWEIGSHGVNHFNFTQTALSITQQELSESKHHIESHLSTPCIHFSYPWGQYSTPVKECVKNAGYQYAVSARHAKLKPHSDIFALPRLNIAREYSMRDFKNIVIGKWDYLGILHQVRGM